VGYQDLLVQQEVLDYPALPVALEQPVHKGLLVPVVLLVLPEHKVRRVLSVLPDLPAVLVLVVLQVARAHLVHRAH